MKRMLFTLSILVLITTGIQAGEAKAVYDKDCAKCHGVDGKGGTKMGEKLQVKDFSDAKVQAELKDEVAIKAIKEGVKRGDKTVMKANPEMKDDEVKDLVAYIRKLKK